MFSALAWPAATVVMAILFRNEIRASLGRLGQVKYRDLEVTFRDDLRHAEALAQAIPAIAGPTITPLLGRVNLEANPVGGEDDLGGVILADPQSSGGLADPAATQARDALDRLAARSPRDAVLEAWSEIGQALVKSATRLGDRRAPAPTRAEDAARFLADRGWLPAPMARLVEKLRALRDRALADHRAPTTDEALRYLDLALPVAAKIARLG